MTFRNDSSRFLDMLLRADWLESIAHEASFFSLLSKWLSSKTPILKGMFQENILNVFRKSSKLGLKNLPCFFKVLRILNKIEVSYWQLSILIFIWKLQNSHLLCFPSTLCIYLFLFNLHLRIYLLILERKEKRETGKHQCEGVTSIGCFP